MARDVGRDSEVWNQAGKHTMLNKLTRVYPHTFEPLMILELKAHSVAMGSVFTTDYNVNTVEIGCLILQSRF